MLGLRPAGQSARRRSSEAEPAGQSAGRRSSEAEPALAVRGVVDWYGPADLAALDEQVGAAGALTDDPLDTRQARLLGAPAAEVPELARAASPLSQVRPGRPRS